MRTAVVFPGQGAQYVGMGRELAEHFPEARRVFERASAALGQDLFRLCAEGPEEALRRTANTQPAILVTSLACLATLPFEPECAAGLSLGEYTALVCAGSLELEDAARLVRLRGAYMQEACPGRDTMMAAVIGLDSAEVRAVCAAAASVGSVEPSNFNSPEQVVIAGDAAAVRAALDAARARGAKRAVPLDVSAPFHTRFMQPAAERLAADLERVPIAPARFPVFANVSGAPLRRPDEIRRALLRQVASPVLWVQSVWAMHEGGIRLFIEVGPGTSVSAMIRRTVPAETGHVEDLASREAAMHLLAERRAGRVVTPDVTGQGRPRVTRDDPGASGRVVTPDVSAEGRRSPGSRRRPRGIPDDPGTSG